MKNQTYNILTINNNRVLLPEPDNVKNIKDYIIKRRVAIENKNFNHYINEVKEDIENFSKAISIVINSILNGKKIGIIGDYDVDGTIGTSMLTIFFRWLNKLENNNIKFPYIYHIPNRFKEGYGPSMFAINKFIEEGIELIITIDSGTTAKKELELAKKHNMEVIVLDHHLIPEEFPSIDAFVNCQNSRNFSYLSGGGLAFVFIIHIQKSLKEIFPTMSSFNFNEFTDLVALSTVCDFVPIKGLNRLLVEKGLKKFNHKYENNSLLLNGAIDLILQYTMYYYNEKSHIRAVDLGFLIGPYINVAGRMADGNLIVEFITNENKERREEIFFQLQDLWQNRRKIQNEILLNLVIDEEKPYILVSGENIHEGIMGIISAQLKDKYNKPTIVISVNNSLGKGSIRSVSPFNGGLFVEKALEKKILIKGGGHEMAAGFSMDMKNMENFKILLNEYMMSMNISDQKDIFVDMVVPISEINKEFYDLVHSLGPYGVAYGELNILFPNLLIHSIYIIGQKHLNLKLMNIGENAFIKALWFFTPLEIIDLLKPRMLISVIGNMKMSNGKIEIQIIDIINES